MRKTVIKQNAWRRWQYVAKNETIYLSSDHKFNHSSHLSYLEPHPKKRKAWKCVDEGSHDAALPGGRANVRAAVVSAV